MDLSTRMSRLGTETAFEVLARAQALEAQGRSIIHLEIGEPDFDTPVHIRRAAIEALEAGFTHYGPSAGLRDLRVAIATSIEKTRHLFVEPEQVVVTPGGKPILFYTMLALLEEGDEAIYPNPGFPIYESMIDFVGAKAVPLRLHEDRNWSFDVDELASLITPRTKLLVLNSPHNPTGGTLDRTTLAGIAALAERHPFTILSDEIYSRMVYEGVHESIATFPGLQERTILLDGFSKTYAMTGWRLGYGVMEKSLATHMARLMTNSNSCTNSFVQKAGIAALEGPQGPAEEMIAEFNRRRDLVVRGLNALPGVTCTRPTGAFYAFPNITGTGFASAELARAMLDEAGVAVLAGTAFGQYGEGYLRLSYANSIPNLEKALERMGTWLEEKMRTRAH
ncbi:MAG: pyridoxal phosphate-dependent aminotransferase [Candidatus Eisenbacteria bacterium]